MPCLRLSTRPTLLDLLFVLEGELSNNQVKPRSSSAADSPLKTTAKKVTGTIPPLHAEAARFAVRESVSVNHVTSAMQFVASTRTIPEGM